MLDDSSFDLSNYGIEEDGPVPVPDESNSIVVQPPNCPLTPAQERELDREVQELAESDFGISQYIATCEFVRTLIYNFQSPCHNFIFEGQVHIGSLEVSMG